MDNIHSVNDHLHYGAYVIISTPSEDKRQRYLYSDGFIVTRIFMKEFTQSSEEDIFGSVFRILPTFKYEAQEKIAEKRSQQNDTDIFSVGEDGQGSLMNKGAQ